MASVLVDVSVARSPAHAKGTGSRPSDGAEEVASPFSDLLGDCEAPEADADEPASKAAAAVTGVKAPAEGAKRVETAEEPKAAAAAADPETDIPAEFMLVIASMDPQSVTPEAATQAPKAAASDEVAPEKTDPDASPDADANAAPVIPAVPAAVTAAVPAPVPVPAIASAPADPAQTAAAIETSQPATPVVDATVTAQLAAEAKIDPAAASKAGAIDNPEQFSPDQKPADPAATPKIEAKPQASAATTDADVSLQQSGKNEPDAATTTKTPHADTLEKPDVKAKADKTPSSPQAPDNSSALLSAPQTVHANARSAIQAAAPQADATNTVPVAGLAVEIAAHAQSGKNRFEVRLDPPELGRIDVRLDVDSDGKVTSHLRVERAETLDLLRRDAPTLERALQQAGLKTSDNGLQFSLRDQSFSQQQQGRDLPAMARIVVPDETAATVETQHYGRLAGIGSGVDIRV